MKCHACKHRATSKCQDCKADGLTLYRFCDKHNAFWHQKRPEHQITRFCHVCHDKLATKLCHSCRVTDGGLHYCDDCYRFIHEELFHTDEGNKGKKRAGSGEDSPRTLSAKRSRAVPGMFVIVDSLLINPP